MGIIVLKRFAVILCGLAISQAGLAQVNLTVVNGELQRTPVAVVPFGWEGNTADAPLDVSAIISAD